MTDVLDGQTSEAASSSGRRIEAGEQAFIDMWTEMGGAERFERRRRWFAANREYAAEPRRP